MTTSEMDFKPSPELSMGVELELQILNSRDYNLARDAADLLKVLEMLEHPGEVKPEITESMIEINSSVHTRYDALLVELRRIRDAVVQAATRLNFGIAGAGSNAVRKCTEHRI